ncbi:heterokaryon incompatibility protein [Botrytis cinerea]
MTRRCTYCANLSLSHLIGLTKMDYKGHVFPNQPTTGDLMGLVIWISALANPDDSPKEKKPIAFYPHHKPYQDLLKSAEMGCDFRVVILTCLKKRIPVEDEEKREDESDELEEAENVYWTDFSRRRETDRFTNTQYIIFPPIQNLVEFY